MVNDPGWAPCTFRTVWPGGPLDPAAPEGPVSPEGPVAPPVEVAPETATLDQSAERTGKFNYKAKGIFNGQFFQQLDESNSNKFYNFFVTKKGDQYGRGNISGALEPNDFEKVLGFAERRIVELAGEILSGKIDVRPYRLNQESQCSYCRFKSVCRFDWQINDYNFLESLTKSQVLETMRTDDG